MEDRMKVEVNESYEFILKEVFSGAILETEEGNQLRVCMRDDTFEFCFVPKGDDSGQWQRFNMQTRRVEKL